jgi:pimeloyl-ACP methyl ester carboxylesterase
MQGGFFMKRILYLLLVAASAALLFSGNVTAKSNPPSDFFVDESTLSFPALPGTSTTRYWGVHKGAGYRIEVPDNWNGDLVLYCHGYGGTGAELSVTIPGNLRPLLIQDGYAWAASSYSKNFYDVQAGVIDTHALGQFFNGLVGKPHRVYVVGHSMGGHVTAKIIEQYPKDYDGALPMCGVMGDTSLYDYFVSYQLAAQAIADIDAEFPSPPNWSSEVLPALRSALGSPFPYVLTPAGEKVRTVVKYLSGGERPLFDYAFSGYGYWANYVLGLDFSDPTRGVAAGSMMENVNTVYQLDSDPALSPEEEALNDMVLRVEADPQGKHPNGLANIPRVAGDPRIPVISMHSIGDLYVPLVMEQIYARRVIANGKEDLVVFRVTRNVEHCGFTPEEEQTAFLALVDWVENGVKPQGDDILSPENVARPDFGCQFTNPQRGYDSYTCPD